MLENHALELSGKEHPNVLYVGTAGGDTQERIEQNIQKFSALGCSVRALALITHRYTEAELDELLSWADVIYVGGGDTVSMMRVWKQYGLDMRLREIYRTDSAVLSGVSAGAICWFVCGHSDSESFHDSENWHFCWAEGMLGLFSAAYCPHYNESGRDSFDGMLKEKKDLVGLAMENGTAFVENGEKRYLIRSAPSAKSYVLRYDGDTLQKKELAFLI